MSNEDLNEVDIEYLQKELKNFDLSKLILIKNPDNEIIIGYNIEGKLNTIIYDSTESDKLIIHNHYDILCHKLQNQLNENYPETFNRSRY